MPATQASALDIEILTEPRVIEPEWRALSDKAGISVYQRFGWIDAFTQTAAPAQGISPAIVTIRAGGRLAMILPLGIERAGALRIARILGGEHANIRMPIVDPDLTDELGDASDLAARIVSALKASPQRVDLLDLDAMPAAWNGGPVILAGHPEARAARLPIGTLRLGADLAATLDAKRRTKKAKKHRSQLNALAPIGGYTFRRAGDPAEARALFAQFRQEKAAWFATMGIADSFAEPGVPEFFDALIERRWDGDEPLLDLYSVEFGRTVHAIFGGGAAGGRLSGYFLSVADDEWRRITPGELLLHDVVSSACADGLAMIDLGRGDERYKWSWLDAEEPQLRLLLPVTSLGQAGLAMIRLADAAERRLRANSRLWTMAKALRRRLAGRPTPEAETAD